MAGRIVAREAVEGGKDTKEVDVGHFAGREGGREGGRKGGKEGGRVRHCEAVEGGKDTKI